LRAWSLPEAPGVLGLTVRVENTTPWQSDTELPRDILLRHALLSVHLLLHISNGSFISMIDPPPYLQPAAQRCTQQGLWPVLVGKPGDSTLILAAPIILYDYPQIAPESPLALFDATEIDELLTLRTLLLTEEEKQEVRATDPRVATLLEALEALPPDLLVRLHGAIRSLRRVSPTHHVDALRCPPAIAPGKRVRLRPALGRTDAQDLFLAGKVAIVEEVRTDITGCTYVGVTLADDPDADLFREWGRFRYFTLDELELLEDEVS